MTPAQMHAIVEQGRVLVEVKRAADENVRISLTGRECQSLIDLINIMRSGPSE